VAATLLIEPDGWAVAIALAAMLVGVLLWVPDGRGRRSRCCSRPAIILWKHRSELAQAHRRGGAAPHSGPAA
jgi:hypothetical protein